MTFRQLHLLPTAVPHEVPDVGLDFEDEVGSELPHQLALDQTSEDRLHVVADALLLQVRNRSDLVYYADVEGGEQVTVHKRVYR